MKSKGVILSVLLGALVACGTASPLTKPAKVDELLREKKQEAKRRAVVIGINNYSRRHWPSQSKQPEPQREGRKVFADLQGAVADANAMVELLVGRYQFERDAVLLLTDHEATHTAIVEAIQKFLVEPTNPGDTLVFYYSGHGSQLIKDGTNESYETIVPADSAIGATDVPDQELKRLWASALERLNGQGALTVIMDSCHSGGTSRSGDIESGLAIEKSVMPLIVQDLPRYDRLANEPEESTLALFISAATASQPAKEIRRRGVFTLALERAISDDASGSIASVFARVHADLKGGKWRQDPILAGRRSHNRNIVGEVARITPIVFPTLHQSGKGELRLQGGSALGLTVGSRLQLWSGGQVVNSTELEVLEVELATATVKIVKPEGGRAIEAGTPFVISQLAVSSAPLRIHLATDGPPRTELDALIVQLKKLASEFGVEVSYGVAASQADAQLTYDGANWVLVVPPGRAANKNDHRLAKPVRAEAIRAVLPPARAPGAPMRLSVMILPYPELAVKFEAAIEKDKRFALSNDQEADYVLGGSPRDGALAWAWFGLHSELSESPLPPYTDAISEGEYLLEDALDQIDRLGRIKRWIGLKSGAGVSGAELPFRISVVDMEHKKEVSSNLDVESKSEVPDKLDRLIGGRSYAIALDPLREDIPDTGYFVYVFAIDSAGGGALIYPQEGHSSDRFSCANSPRCYLGAAANGGPATIVTMCKEGECDYVAYGRESFFVIVTDEQLTNTEALQWAPLHTRERSPEVDKSSDCDDASTSLQCMLESTSRNGTPPKSNRSKWSIQRLDFISEAPK